MGWRPNGVRTWSHSQDGDLAFGFFSRVWLCGFAMCRQLFWQFGRDEARPKHASGLCAALPLLWGDNLLQLRQSNEYSSCTSKSFSPRSILVQFECTGLEQCTVCICLWYYIVIHPILLLWSMRYVCKTEGGALRHRVPASLPQFLSMKKMRIWCWRGGQ